MAQNAYCHLKRERVGIEFRTITSEPHRYVLVEAR